jgi:hypothetical protein
MPKFYKCLKFKPGNGNDGVQTGRQFVRLRQGLQGQVETFDERRNDNFGSERKKGFNFLDAPFCQ